MTDDRRTMVHGMWNAVAPNWAERADFLDVRGAEITKAILDAASIGPTDRVLALADGPGGMALAVAGSAQSVLSSDIAPELVAATQQRAEQRGTRNVTAQVLDIEDIAAPDASFDVVVSREGLMFAVEPKRALGEIARVLRPGGRLVGAVWGPPAANPWLSIVLDSVAEVVGHPVPPPGIPGPFALADEALLVALASGAGLDNAFVERVEVLFHSPDFEAWWSQTTALAGPLSMILAGLGAAELSVLHRSVRARAAVYSADSGFAFPGRAFVLSAQKSPSRVAS